MSESLDYILSQLEFTEDKGLYYDCNKSKQCPSRIKTSLQYIDYDAIYTMNNSPLIIFREFDTLNEFEDEFDDLREAVWNLGEFPILFIVLPNEIRIYNGLLFDEDKENALIFDKKDKLKLKEFEPLNLTSEEFWKKYGKDFQKKETVHDYLLQNLEDVRKELNKKGLPYSTINNLIGRLIFSRYLIDRNVLTQQFFQKEYHAKFEDIIKKEKDIYDFFDYLSTNFKGDMFPITPHERKQVQECHLKLLSHFFKGGIVKSRQAVLFDRYDFKIIPVELISNIYETFLNHEENPDQAHYTPLFLVDYILDEKLNKHLRNNESCKILDPSCGSGVFLVESLRRLIEKNLEKKGKLTESDLKKIVTENIYGIDKNPDAINISIFSIYLTLLDYQDNKNIEEFTFPDLNKNFFVSDFFNLNNDFNEIIGTFDLIVGNPPWGKSPEKLYIDYYEKKEIPVSNKQIAQAFLIRAEDFAHDSSEIALIVTSKMLYNLKAIEFRRYFLKNFVINKVLEFSPVRKKIFKGVIGPGIVLFYRLKNSKDDGNNYIEHISLKPNRLFYLLQSVVIQKFDVKFVPQNYFIKYDWLWAVLIYGSFLDFYLIKRLKEDYPTINDIINKNNLIEGQGVQDNTSDKPLKVPHLLNKNYLDIGIKKKMLQRYYIDKSEVSKWDTDFVHRCRNPELFEPPYVLIKKGLDTSFRSVATFSNEEWVFKDGVTAIKGNEKDEKILKNILGLLNSKLSSYYIHVISSSTGIERAQVHNPEKFSFPAILDNGIIERVNHILALTEEHENEFENKIAIQKELDEYIFALYELNDLEKDLVNYAFDVAMPMYQTNKTIEKLFNPPSDHQLENYAKVFTKHFESTFNGKDEFFCVDIHRTPQFIAMNFKIVSNKPEKQIECKEETDIEEIINKLGALSIEKRNSLYIQRDLKGFNETSFYVIKPNECQNWHRAVARLDIIEFMRDLTS